MRNTPQHTEHQPRHARLVSQKTHDFIDKILATVREHTRFANDTCLSFNLLGLASRLHTYLDQVKFSSSAPRGTNLARSDRNEAHNLLIELLDICDNTSVSSQDMRNQILNLIAGYNLPNAIGLVENVGKSPAAAFACSATLPPQPKSSGGKPDGESREAMITHCQNLLRLMQRYIDTPDLRPEILENIQTRNYIPNALKLAAVKHLAVFTNLRDNMLHAAELEPETARVQAFKEILSQSRTESYGLKTTTQRRCSGSTATWNP